MRLTNAFRSLPFRAFIALLCDFFVSETVFLLVLLLDSPFKGGSPRFPTEAAASPQIENAPSSQRLGHKIGECRHRV